MSPKKPLLALTAALALLGSAATAWAQTAPTCTSDTDCQHGYTCQVSGAVGTGTSGPDCPWGVGCPTRGTGAGGSAAASGGPVPTGGTGTVPADGAGNSGGSDTPAADGGTANPGTTDPGTTTTSTVSSCQPAPCTVDIDCAAGMVCHAETLTTCSGGGKAEPPCPADTKCESTVTDPPVCTSQTVSTCTYKWALPCNADADCGDGFACQPSVTTSCSGGTGGGGTVGTGTVSSGSPGTELVADSCTMTTKFPGSCHPVAVTCATSADCPSNWICQDNVTVVGTGGIAGAGGAAPSTSDGSPVSGSGSGVASADVAPPTFSRSCVAPYTASPEQGGGVGGRTGSSPGSPTTTGNDGNPPPSGSNDGKSATGGTTGSQPTAGAATGGTTGTAGATDDGHGKAAAADNGGGCSAMPGGHSPGAGLLAGVGLGIALLVARRRRA